MRLPVALGYAWAMNSDQIIEQYMTVAINRAYLLGAILGLVAGFVAGTLIWL
jgi:hypothetical protein